MYCEKPQEVKYYSQNVMKIIEKFNLKQFS